MTGIIFLGLLLVAALAIMARDYISTQRIYRRMEEAERNAGVEAPLSERDKALIERGWRRYCAAAPRCTKAPAGWHCTRAAGHDGPCAAEPAGVGSGEGGKHGKDA